MMINYQLFFLPLENLHLCTTEKVTLIYNYTILLYITNGQYMIFSASTRGECHPVIFFFQSDQEHCQKTSLVIPPLQTNINLANFS